MLAKISAGFGFAVGVILAFAVVSIFFELAFEIFYAVLRLVGAVFCLWLFIVLICFLF